MSTNVNGQSKNAFPWREFLTFLGIAASAYFGYLGIRSAIEIPIHATQTAEANKTLDNITAITQEIISDTETPVITPSDFECERAPKIRVQVEEYAIVIQPTTRLRSKPEVKENVLFNLAEGDELKIIDGPICSLRPGRSDYYVFWKVFVPARSLEGWVAEGDSDNYYIEPYQ